MELNTIPERTRAEGSTEEQISGQNVLTSSINRLNHGGSESTPSASSSNQVSSSRVEIMTQP